MALATPRTKFPVPCAHLMLNLLPALASVGLSRELCKQSVKGSCPVDLVVRHQGVGPRLACRGLDMVVGCLAPFRRGGGFRLNDWVFEFVASLDLKNKRAVL